MKKIISFGSLVVVAALLFAFGYRWTTAAPEREGALSRRVKRPLVERAIAAEEERLRNLPGRTGILAEEKRYSLFDEELIIRDFFQDRRGGFFLDVGCAWPSAANNTYYLEKHLGWTGIGIDALDEYAADWERMRPNSKFFSYLVTDHAGTNDTFYKSPDFGLSSTDRDLASGKFFGEEVEPEEVTIPSITLDALLDREGIEKIDLLAMDIEGHEFEALSGFDIDRFQPELVVTEGDSSQVAGYFREHGYELIERYLPFDPANRYFARRPNAERPPR